MSAPPATSPPTQRTSGPPGPRAAAGATGTGRAAALLALALTVLGSLLTPWSPAAAASQHDAGPDAGPVAGAMAGGAPASAWGWPLATPSGPPVLVRGFDPGPWRWSAGDRGVDLAASPGDVVLAPVDGTVVLSRRVVDRGVVVVLSPTGLRATLEPVRGSLAPGSVVRRGEPVGVLEAGGRQCAGQSCLHWGVLTGAGHDTFYRDPLALLRGDGPPVLLPLDGRRQGWRG